MRYLLVILAFSAPAAKAQSTNWAVINDPDGFTNIRLKPDPSSPALYQARDWEVFQCRKQPGDWWQFEIPAGTGIRLPDGKGYIHRSRARLFSEMPDSALQKTICRVLSQYRASVIANNEHYDRYLANGKKFSAQEDAMAKKLSKDHYDKYEYAYSPLLSYLPGYLHRTRDSLVLLEWCKVMAEDTGSASESPGYAMAELFLQAPEWVIGVIRPLPKHSRSVAIGQIEFGLLMDEKLPVAKRLAFEKRLREVENQK